MRKLLLVLAFTACAAVGRAQVSDVGDPMENFGVDLNGGDTLFAGTVSSVGASAPAEFTVANSPITTFGTLVLDWASGSAPSVDDSVLVSISNVWTRKLMTSCSAASSAVTYNTSTHAWGCNTISSGSTSASYITEVAESGLSAEFALGSLTTGLLKNTTTTGVPSIYGGTSCTNQFPRSLDASGAATCASIVNADITAATIDLTTKVTGLLPLANLANGSALSVLGRSANSSGVMASITATAASDQFLQETGSTLAFNNPWIDTQTVILYSDFVGVGSGNISPFNAIVSGTAAANNRTSATSLLNHPGVITLETGTTTTGASEIMAGNVTGHEAFYLASGTGFTFETSVKVTTLSDGTDTYTFRSGMVDPTQNATTTDGVFFDYAQASDTHWRIRACNNTTCTTTNTTNTVTAAQWDALKITCNAAMTSCNFYVNGTEVSGSPLSTNLPINRDTALTCGSMLKSAGTTNRIISMDYCKFFMRLGTTR